MDRPRARPREAWEQVTLGELRDRDRFDAFVREAYARLLALARQLAATREDADDVVQKAFLELHEVVTGRLAQPDALAMGAMVERVRWRACDTARRRRRRPVLSFHAAAHKDCDSDPPSEDGPAGAPPAGPGLAELLIALEKGEDVARLGRQLPGRRGEVFVLLARGDRPVEIAGRLGITKARVSQLVQLVCKELRAKLRDRGWECDETIGVPLRSGA